MTVESVCESACTASEIHNHLRFSTSPCIVRKLSVSLVFLDPPFVLWHVAISYPVLSLTHLRQNAVWSPPPPIPTYTQPVTPKKSDEPSLHLHQCRRHCWYSWVLLYQTAETDLPPHGQEQWTRRSSSNSLWRPMIVLKPRQIAHLGWANVKVCLL